LHVTTLQNENNKNLIPCKFECFFIIWIIIIYFVFLQVWIMDPPSSLFTSNVGKLRAERALYFLPPPSLFQIDKHFKLRKFHSLLAKKFVQSDIVDNDFKKYCFHWESRTQKYFNWVFLAKKLTAALTTTNHISGSWNFEEKQNYSH
jgi:hypothetical protein